MAVCVVTHYLLHMGYTQHWSGELLINTAKVCHGRYILARELQEERTRKWDGSVSAMKTASCYRPCKSFGSML